MLQYQLLTMFQRSKEIQTPTKLYSKPALDEETGLQPMDNLSFFIQKRSTSNISSKPHEKETAAFSTITSKKPYLSRVSQQSAFQISCQQTQGSQQIRNNYEAIECILKNQNINLKKQNQLLLHQISRLKNVNKKYKQTCLGQRIQLQSISEERDAHKRRADDLKKIIMTRLKNLQSKALGDSNFGGAEQNTSPIEGIRFTESRIQEDF